MEFLTDEFYNSKKWKRKSRAVLKRDGYLCQRCLRYGRRTEAAVVHHIKHLKDFPELALADSNLTSLCGSCHNKQHPEKAKVMCGRY